MVLSVYFHDVERSFRNAAVTLTYNSTRCNYPYHQYLIEGENLNNIELTNNQIILRTSENIKGFVEQGLAQQYSLHEMENIFWKYP